ncbi:sensor histidine kinase [Pseudacidovorax intermedius]|uniref:histidine kinase n=1 Tax=Pseudacidovorax intermedius TaxID=433924 RepID=A0A147H028_9BURK|nr:sensor histidine kinase [Pseudacidovorax intermedius]KTT22992.1 histidine kinase [Pseudacidovorax intermedius]
MTWGRRQGDRPRAAAWSLRRRLLATVAGASIAAWLVGLALVIQVAWHSASETFDDALKESARLVLRLGREPGAAAAGGRRGDALRLRIYYQLVSPEGRVLQRGEDAPSRPFVDPRAEDDEHHDVRADGRRWRVFVLRDPATGLQAQVGQPWKERLELLEDIAERLAWPALGLLLLLVGGCWIAIRRLLRPLELAAAGIAAKSPQDLSPVPADGMPRELRPILAALDGLMARLSVALEGERRFTSDAAHELRTPLAALRNRVQLLARQGHLPAEDARQLRADVDRSTQLVESLLALARLDPAQGLEAMEAVALAPLVDEALAHAQAGVADRNGSSAPPASVDTDLAVATLAGHPALLATLVRNLIDNARRYGGPGVRVRVDSRPLPGGGTRLAVRDDGPGVPPAQRRRLGERFFRVLGSGQPGNGLGLSIVARIAALHGARLHFEDGLDGRGLSAVLDFPAR